MSKSTTCHFELQQSWEHRGSRSKAKQMKQSVERGDATEENDKLEFIKAWEERKITKAINRAQKNISAITAWENRKSAQMQTKLTKISGGRDRKKDEKAEKLRNKIAAVHTKAQEKKAKVQTRRAEEILKAEEKAAKLRAIGPCPHKSFNCF